MIINGASRCNVAFWNRHLQDRKKNDRAEVKEIRGVGADNLKEAMLEMLSDATHTRCKNFMYIADFSPTADELLSEDQWDYAITTFEKHRGIPEGQPRVVVEHEKEGRIHRHVIWSRIDLENMKAWSDSRDAKICHAASREISEELGLHRSVSPFDKDLEGERPARHPKHWEMYRGMMSGLDPRDITAEVTSIYRESMSPSDFIAGLQEHGYSIARGDRRNFCILDAAGDVHSLARRLEGVNAKELRTFMSGIDPALLPSITQAKEGYQELKIDLLRDDLAATRREIAWEDALAKAAIEKEEIERQFLEPTPAQERAEGSREKVWPRYPPTYERTKTSPRWHFDDTAKAVGRDRRIRETPRDLRGTAKLIFEAYNQTVTVNQLGQEFNAKEHNPDEFRAKLRESEILLARVTKEEANKSHRHAEFARATGDFAPRFKEGEFVAVTVYGSVFRLNQRVTGENEYAVRRFMNRMNATGIESLEATKKIQAKEYHDPTLTEKMHQLRAFREMLRDGRAVERHKHAVEASKNPEKGITAKDVLRSGKGLARRGWRTMGKPVRAIEGVLNGADRLAEGFIGMFDPELTPQQKAEGRAAELERDLQSDLSRETSQMSAAQEQAQQREAERHGRGHDRDR